MRYILILAILLVATVVALPAEAVAIDVFTSPADEPDVVDEDAGVYDPDDAPPFSDPTDPIGPPDEQIVE